MSTSGTPESKSLDYLWSRYQLSGESRLQHQQELLINPDLRTVELGFCERDIFHWWSWWPWTYDPRNAGTGVSPYLPSELFKRQIELGAVVQGAGL
jgi:hypothetical protein